MGKNKPLTANQLEMVEYYLTCHPSVRTYTNAYRHAYDCEGKKESSIIHYASQAFKNRHVREHLERRNQEIVQIDLGITPQAITSAVADLAFTSHPDVVAIEGGKVVIKDFADLTPAQRRTIKSVKQKKSGIEIEFYPITTALKMLGEMSGMYSKDNTDGKTYIFNDDACLNEAEHEPRGTTRAVRPAEGEVIDLHEPDEVENVL